MKRYHVISISVLIGLIVGLSVSKAAEAHTVENITAKSGSYICGNTGLTAHIEIEPAPQMVLGHIAHKAFVSVVDEAGKAVIHGAEYLDVSGNQAYTNKGKTAAVFDGDSLVIMKNNKEEYYCAL
ncbi:hypothetical protein EE88_21710 [Salmonella enterica]|nr:hypothetical protein [Salmonella enterica]